MSEETTNEEPQITDEQAQEQIANMFIALDAVYNLHSPNQASDVWTCDECNGVEWPCKTEKIILESLKL